MMTPDEILEIDAKRNHPEGTSAGNLRADINEELENGGDLVQHGNTLIVYRGMGDGVVEHHSFNADTPDNLLNANMAFWRMLKKANAKIARTTYENPKINDLLEIAKEEFDINIKQEGSLFTAEVRL
jgi:hypothetical protein